MRSSLLRMIMSGMPLSALDTPQYLKDGTGPFTETTVEAWRLELAPSTADASAVDDASTEQDTSATH